MCIFKKCRFGSRESGRKSFAFSIKLLETLEFNLLCVLLSAGNAGISPSPPAPSSKAVLLPVPAGLCGRSAAAPSATASVPGATGPSPLGKLPFGKFGQNQSGKEFQFKKPEFCKAETFYQKICEWFLLAPLLAAPAELDFQNPQHNTHTHTHSAHRR